MNRRAFLKSTAALALTTAAGGVGAIASAQSENDAYLTIFNIPLKGPANTIYDVFAKSDNIGNFQAWAVPWADGRPGTDICRLPDECRYCNTEPIPNGPPAREATWIGCLLMGADGVLDYKRHRV